MTKGALVVLAVLCASAAACRAPGAVERAQRLVRLHQEPEALATLRAELTKHPEDLASRRMLVRVLAWSGDLEGAKKEVAELERRLPNDPAASIELGHAFELSHRFDEALAAYDAAASIAPDSPAGPREGGIRSARWGEADDARPRLEEAIKRGARDAETFHVLGLVCLKLRDLDGAEEAYRQGLTADPKSTENLLGLATVAVVRGDGAAALDAYDRILARKPTFAAAELGRAWALVKLGRNDDARRALEHAEALGAPRENVAKLRATVAR